MTRLYVICEGLTEANFVSQLLKPHLELRAPGRVIVSATRLDGYRTYAKLKKDVRGLLRRPGADVIVTTMVDLFKVPADYPGVADSSSLTRPLDRVQHIEIRCREDFGDDRFLPHLQLHEFEALVLTDLVLLAEQHPHRRRDIRDLAERLEREFESPEDVNRSEPPSYRICRAVPEYQKAVDGILTVAKIGLPALRQRCRHFGAWIDRLESVGA